MTRRTIAALLCVVIAVGCTDAKPQPAAQASSAAAPQADAFVMQDGIVYGHAAIGSPASGQADLLLDLYQPTAQSTAARPVVVLIHGGGFTMQSRKDDNIRRIAEGLATDGIVVASIDYRLQGQQPEPSTRVQSLRGFLGTLDIEPAMVAAVEDTLTAIDYLHSHAAELHIDAGRLGLVGSSAGAITADHVAYILDEHGIVAPTVRFVGSLWGGIFIPSPDSNGEPAANQLSAGEAALFAVHGDADPTISVALEDELVARANALGIATEYHRIPSGGHGYSGTRFFTEKVDGDQTPYDRLLAFARDHLQ